MKTIIILLLLASTGLTGQKTDTIYINIEKVKLKKTTITTTEVKSDGTEVATKVTFDKDKAIKEIERMKQDTANLTKYLENLRLTEKQIAEERKLVKQKQRVLSDLIDKLGKLLAEL